MPFLHGVRAYICLRFLTENFDGCRRAIALFANGEDCRIVSLTATDRVLIWHDSRRTFWLAYMATKPQSVWSFFLSRIPQTRIELIGPLLAVRIVAIVVNYFFINENLYTTGIACDSSWSCYRSVGYHCGFIHDPNRKDMIGMLWKCHCCKSCALSLKSRLYYFNHDWLALIYDRNVVSCESLWKFCSVWLN